MTVGRVKIRTEAEVSRGGENLETRYTSILRQIYNYANFQKILDDLTDNEIIRTRRFNFLT